jgi:nucleoside-diphosphate-sugar epimerase
MSESAIGPEGPVVVTGGAGFLGGVVVEQLLARGVTDIRVLDLVLAPRGKHADDPRGTVRYFQGDLRSDELGEAFDGARTILHLAACQYHTPVASSTYELPFFEINVEGTRRVLEAAKAGGARHLVFVSTNMVYGLPRELPLTEKHPLEPFGPYGKSKLEAERLVEAAQSATLDCAIVRPGLIVGPGRTGVVERVFGWIRSGRPIVMIGNANNRYEVMHVEDVASLVIAASTHRGFGAYNCASVSVPTMREWIEAVKMIASSRSPIIGVPGRAVKPVLAALEYVRLAPLRKDQYLIADVDYYMSAGLAKKELGWSPTFTGRDAILDTYRWYLERSAS